MTDLYEELDALTPEQRRLAEALLRKEGIAAERLPIPCRRDRSSAPLSIAQRRIWALTRLTGGLPTENVPVAVEIRGPLDVGALERSLDTVIRRHDMLRTVFPLRDGRPQQVVLPHEPLSLPVADLSDVDGDAGERRTAAGALLADRAAEPFELSRDPLCRPLLVRVDPGTHFLLITMHHLSTDGWGVDVMFREMSAVYQAARDGREPTLPELDIQYGDLAAWQSRGFAESGVGEQIEFWKGRLRGAPPLLGLSTDRPRPPVPSFRGSVAALRWGEPLSGTLRDLSKASGVTLFTSLLAGLKALLYRYTGVTDVIVGTLVSQRGRPEAENLIGNLGNNVLLRSDLSGNPSFRELVRRVNDVVMDAIAHQDAPLEDVQRELEREGGRIPMFQIGFIFRNRAAAQNLSLPGLQVRKRVVDLGTARLDLWFDMVDDGTHIEGDVQYRSDLWSAATMQRLVTQYGALLEAASADPDAPIDALDIGADAMGPRVDSGAVEAALRQHPAVREAAVLPATPLTGGPTQVWTVRQPGAQATVTELREFVKERVALGPVRFHDREELPRRADGAVDFASLRGAHLAGAGSRGELVEPEGDTEELIARLWRDVLGLKRVGANDNFFDLGGHSLLATEVLDQIERRLSVRPEASSIVTGSLRQLAAQCVELGDRAGAVEKLD